MRQKQRIVVLDFDGFLLNSYYLLRLTFARFGLDIGDVARFQHRGKFLKYMGGGKEFLRNLVYYSLPKKKQIRNILTEVYREHGRVYSGFVPLINSLIDDPATHVGILSRNYTRSPGETIRAVLQNSGINEALLDFVIPIPPGVKKHDVLQGMKSRCFEDCIFGGDEIGDYRAAADSNYKTIIIASYGFDNRKRLVNTGKVPGQLIYDSPAAVANRLIHLLQLDHLRNDVCTQVLSGVPSLLTRNTAAPHIP